MTVQYALHATARASFAGFIAKTCMCGDIKHLTPEGKQLRIVLIKQDEDAKLNLWSAAVFVDHVRYVSAAYVGYDAQSGVVRMLGIDRKDLSAKSFIRE